MPSRWTGLLAFTIIAIAWAGAPAEAEWALDVYGGASWTRSTDIHVTGRDDRGTAVNLTIFDVKTDTGAAAGLRAGYWIDPLPFLGFGMDLFYFSIPVPSQTTTGTGTLNSEFLGKPISINGAGQAQIPSVILPALGFSPELRLRWPLITSKAYPQGVLQPYLTGGPAWAVTLKSDHVSLVTGAKFGAGLSINLVRFVALFAEYRYSFFPNFTFSHTHISYEADIESHAAIVGVSLRF